MAFADNQTKHKFEEKIWPTRNNYVTEFYHDFEYAVWAWKNLRTYDALDEEWMLYEADYQEWKALNKTDKKQAREVLFAETEKSARIRKARDLRKTFQRWTDIAIKNFRKIAYNGYVHPVDKEIPKNVCRAMKRLNFFTRSCLDYPDWRSDKVKQDTAKAEAAKEAKREAERQKMEDLKRQNKEFMDEFNRKQKAAKEETLRQNKQYREAKAAKEASKQN